MSDLKRIHVYCGNYVGAPKWQSPDYYAPDECDWEGWIVVEVVEGEDWRHTASFTCPGCGARNMVTDHET